MSDNATKVREFFADVAGDVDAEWIDRVASRLPRMLELGVGVAMIEYDLKIKPSLIWKLAEHLDIVWGEGLLGRERAEEAKAQREELRAERKERREKSDGGKYWLRPRGNRGLSDLQACRLRHAKKMGQLEAWLPRLEKEWGVSAETMRRCLNGETFRHLPMDPALHAPFREYLRQKEKARKARLDEKYL